MTIGVDVSRANRLQRTGPASYAWHVIRELVRNQKSEISLLAPDGPLPEWGTLPSGITWKELRWVGPGWTSIRLPLHLASAKYNVFWQPTASLDYLPRQTRGVVTVHDLAFLEAPHLYSGDDLRRQHRMLKSGLRYVARCIAPSEYTKQQIVRLTKFPADKIAVTPLAADDGMAPQPLESVRAAMERHGLRSPYIITAGRIEKKKGIVEIVQALAQLPKDVQLVLCGRDGFGAEEVRQRIADLNLADRVKFLGWVPDADLACLLCGATCYVSACRYEGFGIAVLDALACGCPVVAYRAGAVPETVGDAALLVDPSGSDHLVTGIRQVLDSMDTYHRLAKLGVERARAFSWKRTAEQTYSSLTEW